VDAGDQERLRSRSQRASKRFGLRVREDEHLLRRRRAGQGIREMVGREVRDCEGNREQSDRIGTLEYRHLHGAPIRVWADLGRVGGACPSSTSVRNRCPTLRIDVPANAYVSCLQLRSQGVAQRQLETVVIFAFVFTRLTFTHRGGP
jgi:hypothetical protein